MPWNDNANPGPWGSPPPGDEDRRDQPPRRPNGGGGGPQRPDGPDLNAGVERLRRLLGGPGGRLQGRTVLVIAGVVAGLWALSGLYVVQPTEAAVVTTFGA